MDLRINFENCEPVFPFWGAVAVRTFHDRGAVAGLAAGFASGTEIGTPDGPRAVETLRPGDLVSTLAHGAQRVRAVQHGYLWRGAAPCPAPLWPLSVPAGAMGNTRALTLLPEQSVLIECDLAKAIHGEPFVLLPARLLDGVMGVRRFVPDVPVEVAIPLFDEPQITFANGDAPVFCPAFGERSGHPSLQEPEERQPAGYARFEPILTRVLIAALRIEEAERDGPVSWRQAA